MRKYARHLHTGLVALVVVIVVASAGTSAQPFPDLIPLPADFGPEGIAVGNGSTFYTGSLAASTRGQILVGDLRTGEITTLVAPDGVPATGMLAVTSRRLSYRNQTPSRSISSREDPAGANDTLRASPPYVRVNGDAGSATSSSRSSQRFTARPARTLPAADVPFTSSAFTRNVPMPPPM